MTLQKTELFGTERDRPQAKRAYPAENGIFPGKLAQQSTTDEIPHLTPLYCDESASNTWKIWLGDVSEINTLTAHAATPATAGDFTLTVNGQTTAAIAFDADAADVQAALEALSNVAVGDVTCVDSGSGTDLGDASHVVTINWKGALAGTDITITADFTGISAGSDPTLATSQAGGADTTPGSEIDGFLWCPADPVVGNTSGEILVQIFRRGQIHRDDIPIPTGEGQVDLDEALLASNLREKGIDVMGLAGIH